MLFNSIEYFLFLPIVLLIYGFLTLRAQNIFLVLASYFFYGWWDWRFLSLILISTIVDYYCGKSISRVRSQEQAKKYVFLSVILNLSILGFFKYYNFFADSFISLLGNVGYTPSWFELNVVLPVGISFYTFQTITYSVDVYRGKVKATHSLVDFALFVSFFPQLVAGPIEKASSLLPQIQRRRVVTASNWSAGGSLILWGLVKKVFIADNLATFVDAGYANYTSLTAVEVILITVAFAFQIYCDFSGYSDIARGTAKLLGFELRLNFNLPYFAKNPSDFWRRWHISLSEWLREYLYISLGGNRKGKIITYRNLMITMLLGGLWHGAAWTFVLWGAYQGALLCLHRFFSSNFRFPSGRYFSVFSIAIMFCFTCYGWLVFRADSFEQIHSMTYTLMTQWQTPWENVRASLHFIAVYTWPLFIVQAIQKTTGNLNFYLNLPRFTQNGLFALGLYLLFVYGSIEPQGFIYFQF